MAPTESPGSGQPPYSLLISDGRLRLVGISCNVSAAALTWEGDNEKGSSWFLLLLFCYTRWCCERQKALKVGLVMS